MSFKKSFYNWCVDNNRKDLLDRWNYELNNIDPTSVGHSSGNKYYFNCEKNINHKPELVRLSHITGDNVQVACKSCNSFAQWCIDNMSQDFIDKYWCETLNNDIDPWQIGRASHKNIWLMCNNGFDHYYSTSPHNFINGTHECQVCNGQVVFNGFNDLFTTDPHLINLWNFNKNINISPDKVSRGSMKKVWWKCDICGHEWMASVHNIVNGKRCPICAQRKKSSIFISNKLTNAFSFGDCFPQLLDMWDYEKNKNIDPFKVFPSYRNIVFWKCQNGHSFQKSIVSMCKTALNNECLCRYCNGVGVVQGKNDLLTVNPELVLDWNYEKNVDCSPNTITFGSTKRIWWRCHICGYEWQTSPNSRTNLLSGCPECARHFTNSKLQIKVEDYINKTYGFNILHERDCTIIATNPRTNYLLPYDNDVNINGIHLIIEVHGEQHYNITEFTKVNAVKRGVTPEEELSYQQYKDKIKKDYAISYGYEYLEIPYYTLYKQKYKELIDYKIQEILTIQN